MINNSFLYKQYFHLLDFSLVLPQAIISRQLLNHQSIFRIDHVSLHINLSNTIKSDGRKSMTQTVEIKAPLASIEQIESIRSIFVTIATPNVAPNMIRPDVSIDLIDV